MRLHARHARAGGAGEATATAAAPGALWIAGEGRIARLGVERSMESFPLTDGEDNAPEIHALAMDTDGTLWVGALDAMHRLHDGQIVEHIDSRALHGLGNLSVWSFARAEPGLLAGSDDGVWSFHDDRFTALIPGTALPNPVAYSLLHATDGRLYVGTRAGFRHGDARTSRRPRAGGQLRGRALHSRSLGMASAPAA